MFRQVGASTSLLLSALRFAAGIVMIVQCFRIKDILQDHLAGPGDAAPQLFAEHVRLSGLMTFFFSIFYLQYVINRYILPAAAERALQAQI